MSVPLFLRLRRRARSAMLPSHPSDAPLLRLWVLRMLVLLDAQRALLAGGHGFANDALARVVGLDAWVDVPEAGFDLKAIKTELRQAHEAAEQAADQARVAAGGQPGAAPPAELGPGPGFLARNLERLSHLVGLTEVDQAVLAFVVHLHSERLLDDAADMLGQLSAAKVLTTLSVVLDVPLDQVRGALGVHGVLARSGLVSLDRGTADTLRGKLELLSEEFADHVLSDDAAPMALLRGVVKPAALPHLTQTDYPHIQDSMDILVPYLRHALDTGRKGVNVFVYGAPGTGKSQLVKVLAQLMGCELFEVACEDPDGDPVSGSRRLRAFRAAQSFFGQQQALILFDEVEDVFNDDEPSLTGRSTAQQRKAWINRALEENAAPTFWLSNAVQDLDPAFVRRFDLVVELPVPPKAQRLRILQGTCNTLLDEPMLQRLAACETLAPAVVSRVASVVRVVAERLGPQRTTHAFQHLVNQTLKAQGHATLARHDPDQLPEVYDPAFVCADADLVQVAHSLVNVKSGRLCLYGPSGTGKTAYARWLAAQLGQPLLLKRASDLVSKYLGETEQRMAQAFRQAEQDGAVLLLDEVDSFLQDRRGAQRSWEVSQVNEMLTQMESFAGVLVASTNLMTQLDQAALRRFDLKVRFDHLQPAQAWGLFERHCQHLWGEGGQGLAAAMPMAVEAQARLRRLNRLTPGDFATVLRQSRLQPLPTPLALVSALEQECGLKEGGIQGRMGFVP